MQGNSETRLQSQAVITIKLFNSTGLGFEEKMHLGEQQGERKLSDRKESHYRSHHAFLKVTKDRKNISTLFLKIYYKL